MVIIVNALSSTNLSGPNVLLGHLSCLAKWKEKKHHYVVLYHRFNKNIRMDLGPNVEWIKCPDFTSKWMWRTLWEYTILRYKLKELKADALFTVSGTVIGNCSIPQVCMALNPWCMVPVAQQTTIHRIKAFIQRKAYKYAVEKSTMMAYASEYIKSLYVANASRDAVFSSIVYPGLNDDILEAVEKKSNFPKRKDNRIVCVSRMLPHKGVEKIISAISILRDIHKLDTDLYLVGGWADLEYRSYIQKLVEHLGLNNRVYFKGHIDRMELFYQYAEAKVFCLLSLCESFGIPSVEAQAFGTPVVSSNCCAIPEVCGEGGVYVNPDDINGVADVLAKLLTDNDTWSKYSDAAVKNAAKYCYKETTKPLIKMFDIISSGAEYGGKERCVKYESDS